MREKDLYRAIDKLLPRSIRRQSLTGAAMTGNGIPDRYYSGPRFDLFVEYKMLRAMPRDGVVRAALTPLQRLWLDEAAVRRGGSAVAVIVGLPDRTAFVMRDGDWREGADASRWRPWSLQEVAQWIQSVCGD